MVTILKDFIAPWASVGLGLKDVWDGAKNIRQLWSHKRGVENVTRKITTTTEKTDEQFPQLQQSLAPREDHESTSVLMGRSVCMQAVGSGMTMASGLCNSFNAIETFAVNFRAAENEVTQQDKDSQSTVQEAAYLSVAVSEGVNGLVHTAHFITGTIAYCKSQTEAETQFNKRVAIHGLIQALASFTKSGGALASYYTKNADYSIATGVLGGGVAFVAECCYSKGQKRIAQNNPTDPGVLRARLKFPRPSGKTLRHLPVKLEAINIMRAPLQSSISSDSGRSPPSIQSPSGPDSPDTFTNDKSTYGIDSPKPHSSPAKNVDNGANLQALFPVVEEDSDSSDEERVKLCPQSKGTTQIESLSKS